MNRSIRARSSVKPDRRKLSDVARHVVLPKDIVTTGWPKVEAQARLCGIEYDDWQRQLGRCILGKTSDGVYAAGIGGVAVSICRQVGKTFLIGAILALVMGVFVVIVTALHALGELLPQDVGVVHHVHHGADALPGGVQDVDPDAAAARLVARERGQPRGFRDPEPDLALGDGGEVARPGAEHPHRRRTGYRREPRLAQVVDVQDARVQVGRHRDLLERQVGLDGPHHGPDRVREGDRGRPGPDEQVRGPVHPGPELDERSSPKACRMRVERLDRGPGDSPSAADLHAADPLRRLLESHVSVNH